MMIIDEREAVDRYSGLVCGQGTGGALREAQRAKTSQRRSRTARIQIHGQAIETDADIVSL